MSIEQEFGPYNYLDSFYFFLVISFKANKAKKESETPRPSVLITSLIMANSFLTVNDISDNFKEKVIRNIEKTK